MTGQSAKRQKTIAMAPAKRRKIAAKASAGVPAIDSLPPELMDTIFGFLDVGTLCTARLVCAHFRSAASRGISSVEISVETLRSRPETHLNNFPNLSRVSVCDVKSDDLPMLAQSPFANAVTHLRADKYFWPVVHRTRNAVGLPLLPLPNLTSLTVTDAYVRAVTFPQALRELNSGSFVTDQTANTLTALTNLTCLRINIQYMRKPFEAVTALTALRRLEIYGDLSVVPFVAELTLLTHLHFRGECRKASPSDVSSLSSLSRLSRLVHLGFCAQALDPHISASLERRVLSSRATFNGLRSLDLVLCRRPERSAFETVCMAPFCQLTALRLKGFEADAFFLPRFNLERLQHLSVSCGVQLDREGVGALRRATGLTHLQLGNSTVGGAEGFEELRITLLRLSQLRSLSFFTPAAAHPTFSVEAIALLTELTLLKVGGPGLGATPGPGVASNADLEVCLALKKLRVLEIGVWVPYLPPTRDRITHETFFALAKLPELRKFTIFGKVGNLRGDLTDNFLASLNAERRDKGWPPLELNIWASR